MTKLLFVFLLSLIFILPVFAQESSLPNPGLLRDFPSEIYVGDVDSFIVGEYLPNSTLKVVKISAEYIPEVLTNDVIPAAHELSNSQYNNKWHMSFKTKYAGTWNWVVVASFKGEEFWFYKSFRVIE